MVKETAIKDLRARLYGDVITPADAGYDEVRRIHNGMFVRRPALIARCLGTADVVDAVRFARTHGLELAVRGGGHSVAGKSVCEGGLMLDLSRMKGINLMVVSQWLDPSDDEKNITWARATYDALGPYMSRESYLNYQTEEETEGALEHAYGPNYARLVALKNKLDPTNVFHLNSNVRPSA